MKRFVLPILLTGALLSSCSDEKGAQAPEEPEVPAPEEPADRPYIDIEPLEMLAYWDISTSEKDDLASLNDFAFRLNRAVNVNSNKLWSDAAGNYSFSPLSISVFLSALSQCVDGQAREDISTMLGMDKAAVAELSNKLQRFLMKDMEYIDMSLSNSIWHVPSMPILDAFKERMALQFGAPVNALDLYSDEAVDVLNAWCSDKTRGMIPELFKDAPCQDFVLANALYFSAQWINPFYEDQTVQEVFHGQKGDSEVAMMHKTEVLSYAKAGGVDYVSLSLPNFYEMDILLPADIETFAREFDAEQYGRLIESASGKEVTLSLPRFSDERSANIVDLLRSLGYPSYDMSTEEMTGSSLYPLLADGSHVLHATSLKVNEEGTIMGAITAGSWASSNYSCPEYEKVEMRVDRPFYYIIRNTQCGAILLMGRVNNL